MSSPGATDADGRRVRREQNREAVLDALVALFAEGVYEPGIARIAERAGLSARSLFRYFDDVDDLHRAATARQLRRARSLLDIDLDPAAPLEERIDRLVEARTDLFEEIAPAARAGRACAHRLTAVAAELAAGRKALRAQVRALFGPELERGEHVLAAVDVLCSFESYDLLRTVHGMSKDRAAAVLRAALGDLLGAGT